MGDSNSKRKAGDTNMKRVFVGGLEAGKNFPIRNEPFLDLTDCNDLIVADRQYFLDNEDLIRDWALNRKNPRLISKTFG